MFLPGNDSSSRLTMVSMYFRILVGIMLRKHRDDACSRLQACSVRRCRKRSELADLRAEASSSMEIVHEARCYPESLAPTRFAELVLEDRLVLAFDDGTFLTQSVTFLNCRSFCMTHRGNIHI